MRWGFSVHALGIHTDSAKEEYAGASRPFDYILFNQNGSVASMRLVQNQHAMAALYDGQTDRILPAQLIGFGKDIAPATYHTKPTGVQEAEIFTRIPEDHQLVFAFEDAGKTHSYGVSREVVRASALAESQIPLSVDTYEILRAEALRKGTLPRGQKV